jgi:hypothetical protein
MNAVDYFHGAPELKNNFGVTSPPPVSMLSPIGPLDEALTADVPQLAQAFQFGRQRFDGRVNPRHLGNNFRMSEDAVFMKSVGLYVNEIDDACGFFMAAS